MKCKECKGCYKYQSRSEYEVFSPMFYIESYDTYKRNMMCEKCSKKQGSEEAER